MTKTNATKIVKLEQHEYSGFLRIDAQTRRDGNSAVLLAKDDNTEVCLGGLYAMVTMHDLRIQVTMNPDQGKWRNLEWARRRALDVVLAPDTVSEVLVALCALNRSVGKVEGREELQNQLSKLLGWNR